MRRYHVSPESYTPFSTDEKFDPSIFLTFSYPRLFMQTIRLFPPTISSYPAMISTLVPSVIPQAERVLLSDLLCEHLLSVACFEGG